MDVGAFGDVMRDGAAGRQRFVVRIGVDEEKAWLFLRGHRPEHTVAWFGVLVERRFWGGAAAVGAVVLDRGVSGDDCGAMWAGAEQLTISLVNS